MTNWNRNVDDILEWADGSFDAVYFNEHTGEREFAPATANQIAAYKRYVDWVEAGRAPITISLSSFVNGVSNDQTN